MATLRFLSIVCTAIVLAGGLAHLFELPNKIRLPAEAYRATQQIYRGWHWLGIPLLVALATTAVLAFAPSTAARDLYWIRGALACLALNLVVFFTVTFPVNRKTGDWTRLPSDWEALRRRWEYSHALNALLAMLALCLLILPLV